MTPNKNKRPLPSSTSMAFPEPPETSLQWKAALMQVNILYLRGQWKHCAAQCNQLLQEAPPHPLHATYLHFYSAVSSEAIARLAHNLSPIKIQLLEQAKASYQAAASSLPQPDVAPECHDQSDADTRSTSSTMSEEDSDSWNRCPPSSSGSSRYEQFKPNTSSRPSMETNMAFPQPRAKLRPAPLRIRKIPSFRNDELTDSGYDDDDEQSSSPCIRYQSPPRQQQQHHHPTSPTFSLCPSSTTSSSLQTYKYNHSLLAFSSTINTHISTVSALIQNTHEVQNARYFTKRLLAGSGSGGGPEDEETKAANLRFRIARLKAGGWKVERFQPERYRVLCERALAEL